MGNFVTSFRFSQSIGPELSTSLANIGTAIELQLNVKQLGSSDIQNVGSIAIQLICQWLGM